MLVDNNINEFAFNQLKEECKNMTKTYHLNYEKFERQSYITNCPSNIASLIFKIRSKVLSCRDNHHTSHQITTCRLCNTRIETQNHIINCKEVCSPEDAISLQTYMSSSFEIDLDQLHEIEKRYKQFHSHCSKTN